MRVIICESVLIDMTNESPSIMHTITSLITNSASGARTSPYGETPLPFAPQIRLGQGKPIVPQQFLSVERNVRNIEAILNKIDFANDYLLFAGEINGVLYLQVGIIGCENYPQNAQQASENKIVYGRRWLLEPATPTSEVVQTALLAIKKAREHELRENLSMTLAGQRSTTPFNTHMDLPLMKSNPTFFTAESAQLDKSKKISFEQRVIAVLESLRLKSFNLSLDKIILIGQRKSVIEMRVKQTHTHTHFPEFRDLELDLLCLEFNESEFLHELMNKLIKVSNRHVEEQFTFDGFARFSQQICPKKVAEFSYQTRNIKTQDPRFHQHFKNMSYDVDSTKAPTYSSGALGQKQRAKIRQNKVQGGYLPKEPQKATPLNFESA